MTMDTTTNLEQLTKLLSDEILLLDQESDEEQSQIKEQSTTINSDLNEPSLSDAILLTNEQSLYIDTTINEATLNNNELLNKEQQQPLQVDQQLSSPLPITIMNLSDITSTSDETFNLEKKDLHMKRLVSVKIIKGLPKKGCYDEIDGLDYSKWYLCDQQSNLVLNCQQFMDKNNSSFILCNYPNTFPYSNDYFNYRVIDLKLSWVTVIYKKKDLLTDEQHCHSEFTWNVSTSISELPLEINIPSSIDKPQSNQSKLLYHGSNNRFPSTELYPIWKKNIEKLYFTSKREVIVTCYQNRNNYASLMKQTTTENEDESIQENGDNNDLEEEELTMDDHE